MSNFLTVSEHSTEELTNLLENNIIGTPGKGMLYQQMNVRDKIKKIKIPFFVNLKKDNSIIATCCFCKRSGVTGEGPTSFYIRYFSFKANFRSPGVLSKSLNKKGGLRTEILNLLQGKSFKISNGDRFFHYAYVDPTNIRSFRLIEEFGFQKVREFSTILFYRFFPKNQLNILKLEGHEVDEMKELLKGFYSNYKMFCFDNLFNDNNYYVIKEKGIVVAGASVNLNYWKILNAPGLFGKLLINYFHNIPLLNRILNKDHHFISIEGIYFKEGHEKLLEPLFEFLLYKFKVHSALMWADNHSHLFYSVNKIDLGLINKVNKKIKADVVCYFKNYDKNEIENFMLSPSYISSTDLT
ncbi:MAG: hypothetical protein M3512_07070 [Bacteroidota bacterium]|nr:hypothetical protein [Bacteroidota bacterium]